LRRYDRAGFHRLKKKPSRLNASLIITALPWGYETVRPDGIIETVAGTSQPGDGPDDPTPATEVALNQPNGLWVRGTGVVYVLDTGNATWFIGSRRMG